MGGKFGAAGIADNDPPGRAAAQEAVLREQATSHLRKQPPEAGKGV